MVERLGGRVGRGVAAAAWLGGAAGLAMAQPTFSSIGVLTGYHASTATGVSADGTTVVGTSQLVGTVTGARAMRWTASGGPENLAVPGLLTYANAVNADGTVVVGQGPYQNAQQSGAFLWTAGVGNTFLPVPGSSSSRAYGVSANGSVVVGSAAGNAFRWSEAVGTTLLPALAPFNNCTANAVSADGSVIVGSSVAMVGRPACRWVGGAVESLGTLPGGSSADASAVNADGTVIVGWSNPQQDRAFRWEGGQMVGLGVLPGFTSSRALGVSADGDVVVGYCSGGTNPASVGFVWTPWLGMRDLNEFLPSVGCDIQGWDLYEATGVSADGTVIVGRGDPNLPGSSYSRGWVASGIGNVLRCGPDLTGSAVPGAPGYGTPNGVLSNDDFFYFLTQFAAGNLAVADVTTTAVPGTPGYGVPNGAITNDDFFYYLTAFAAGCW